jgi:hypothetical protein
MLGVPPLEKEQVVYNFEVEAGDAITQAGYHVDVAIESEGEGSVVGNFANGVPYLQWVNSLPRQAS